MTSGAYCDFGNSVANGATYSHLYNYFTVLDNRKLAPTGWHIPSDEDWTILSNYLGGKDIAGGKMKEVGTTHWMSPNTGADNSSGFTAIGGGWRGETGPFYYWVNDTNEWWSSTQTDINKAVYYGLGTYDAVLSRGLGGTYFMKGSGVSIRCIKD